MGFRPGEYVQRTVLFGRFSGGWPHILGFVLVVCQIMTNSERYICIVYFEIELLFF